MQEVSPLATGRERTEGLFELGFGCKSGAEFLGHFLRLALDVNLGAGVFEEDGLLNPQGELAPMFLNLGQIRATKGPRRLGVGPGGHEHPVGIAEQRAFEKIHRGEVLESTDDEDIFPFVGVAGLLPLQVLGEAGGKGDFAQRTELSSPRVHLAFRGAALRAAVATFAEELVDFGVQGRVRVDFRMERGFSSRWSRDRRRKREWWVWGPCHIRFLASARRR